MVQGLCPHHRLQKWMIVQMFYNEIAQPIRSTIYAGAGEALMNETEDKIYNLVKEIALNNYKWPNERGQPKCVGGKLEVDAITLLFAQADAMTQILDHLNVNVVNSSAPPPCEIYDFVDHLTMNCQSWESFCPRH